MTFWTADNLQRITAGTWPNGKPADTLVGLGIDSRSITTGQVYLAIIGDRHDGHDYISHAHQRGAPCAIVSRIPPNHTHTPLLLVHDTVTALQQLAHAYRETLAQASCNVITISGSNGKTTTRHVLHHVLTHCGMHGTQSPKSFNNHLGVPLTLLAAQPDHDFVCCEVGTNHPGEIATLAAIARPDAAILTSIGEEHLEFFHTLQGVAQEEAAILPTVGPNGLIVMPAIAAELVSPWYDVQEGVALLPIKDDAGVPATLPGLAGQHNRMNAALVLTMARWLGCDAERSTEALRSATTPPGRLRILACNNGMTVLDDTYNANPDSMHAALAVLASMQPGPGGRRVAVLGEMRELGAASADAHTRVRQWARDAADLVLYVGQAFDAPALDDAHIAHIASQLQPGDLVLLKASRGVALERILPAFKTEAHPAQLRGV